MTASDSASNPNYRLRIAVPVYLAQCFDYRVTEQQYQAAQLSARVLVPFGRQNLIGIVMEKPDPFTAFEAEFQLKSITELLDTTALFPPNTLKLLQWAAQYYQFPIGEVLHSALPALLRQGKPYDLRSKIWHLDDADTKAKLTEKQQQAYTILKAHPQGTAESLLNLANIDSKTLTALAKKGICHDEQQVQDCHPIPISLAQTPLTPNEDQAQAIQHILKTQHQYQAFLLDGVTGSGKTEVYLQIMYEVLKKGQQVLVLVPEIGLTPQTISRFQSRFNCHIALLHSGLNESKRLQAWQAAQTGKASIILGTRSAILTPLPRLGLIILDEEHDLSFKQQEGFRYHARDVALYRAYLENCPIILGSATPSIESYALVHTGKMQHLELNQRAGSAAMPKMHIIDLKTSTKQNGISQILIHEIQKRLDKKEQVLVFLNRRGYAPVLLCDSCAWQAKCPHCDANFTVHQQPYQHLHCHHCGSIHRFPDYCPQCQNTELKPIGLGTAKVEEQLQTLFPDTEVIRVDRDSTSRVGSWQKIYDRIQRNEPIILLGTQMLAKGHHFPYVTLVAILDIDSGLLSVDFRATERTAQLIIQVAGRAGRGEHKGEVYLQTLRPDHPLFHILTAQNYRSFALHTVKERQQALMPPFRYAALIRCDSKNQETNQEFLQYYAQNIRANSQHEIDIWGPIPAPMARKAGRYQAHLVLLSTDRARLHFYLRHWWPHMLNTKPSTMKLSLDIDPQELT